MEYTWKDAEELRNYLIEKGYVALIFSCIGFDLHEIIYYDLVTIDKIRDDADYIYLDSDHGLNKLKEYLAGRPISIPV